MTTIRNDNSDDNSGGLNGWNDVQCFDKSHTRVNGKLCLDCSMAYALAAMDSFQTGLRQYGYTGNCWRDAEAWLMTVVRGAASLESDIRRLGIHAKGCDNHEES